MVPVADAEKSRLLKNAPEADLPSRVAPARRERDDAPPPGKPAARGTLPGVPAPDPMVPTIFHEPWWLAAMAGDRLEEVTVAAGGRMVGRFPFVVVRSFGGRTSCEMPPLTHFLGPAVDEGAGSSCNRALKRSQIIRELLEQMPRTGGFHQRMHRGIPDTMVFAEQGYRTPVQFTFEVAPAPEAVLWKNMRDKTRNVIRRAREGYEVVELDDPERFVALYRDNILARGGRFYYRRDDVARLCAEALARGCGRVVAARGANGALAAAIFHVWDAGSAYYLLSTRDAGSDNAAASLLVWDAIRHAAARGLVFDFDGVASHGSRVFFTGFGGEIRPRYVATRYSRYYSLSDKLIEGATRRLTELAARF